MIGYNDGTKLHSPNLERPRTDVTINAILASVNAELVLDLNGEATFYLDIRGTFVGTFLIEGSADGQNYFALPVINQASQLWLTSLTAVGAFVGNPAGLSKIRVRCSAYTSGSPVVTLRASLADDIVLAMPMPSTITNTNTGVAAAAVTLTLAAPGAGLFHYITRLIISRFATALLTAGATPVLATTTNLPGTRVFSFPAEAAAQGTIYNEIVDLSGNPLKSSTANTATTIVCPATTGVIWRVTADYYTAA